MLALAQGVTVAIAAVAVVAVLAVAALVIRSVLRERHRPVHHLGPNDDEVAANLAKRLAGGGEVGG